MATSDADCMRQAGGPGRRHDDGGRWAGRGRRGRHRDNVASRARTTFHTTMAIQLIQLYLAHRSPHSHRQGKGLGRGRRDGATSHHRGPRTQRAGGAIVRHMRWARLGHDDSRP